ncbi:CorA Mg2+ and Co2+ transporters [Acidimicrobiia bacterium]|jgi:magnesium transporter
MLSATVYNDETSWSVSGVQAIVSAITEPSNLLWIDLEGPDEEELDEIARGLDLHELAVEDVRKHGQRAKLNRYPLHAFLVAYARAEDGDMCEVDFFIGPNWLVTVRETNDHGETFPIAEVARRYERIRSLDTGVGFLLYCLLDELVDGYFGEAEKAEDALEVIEETLFDLGPPTDGTLQQELLDLRRSMITFRRKVVPLRDVALSLLRREVPWIEDAAIVYFEDVFDHLLRVIDQIDTQRELMGNVVDASLALTSNRMNEVMKKMTSWGAILIVATLIAGIYGMNFTDMPELHWRFGYYGALGLMLFTTSCLYFYFRRKKWL